MTPAQILSQSFRLPNGTILKNRLVKSAMSEALGTPEGSPDVRLERLYGRIAAGGIGLSITGNVMIDGGALGEPGNVVIEGERDLEALRRWAVAGQQQDSKLWVQINHPGKQAPRGLNRETVAPSAIPFRPDLARFFATPRELRSEEIEGIIERFAVAARVVKKAGFGGVQIHGAHGYLVSQFLSPHHNQRRDEWGGSAPHRRRFVLAVLKAMREQVGPEFPIGIKLNSADFQRGGFSEEESIETIQALAQAGIELVEISGGTYEAPVMTGKTKVKDSTQAREAYFLEFAEKARAAIQVPLVVTGGFRTAEGMASAIASGAVDLVGLARSIAVEPDLPAKLMGGIPAAHPIKPLSTGIKAIDRMGFLEIVFYAYQLGRMGQGLDPLPDRSVLAALASKALHSGWNGLRLRRLRA
ncbi:NADH oxidoreductase [Planctomyces bekefii]|uniref:NADH oxidoreductase n=1 Tax=Planctomyces bekefii TaxID=1653850 RepID=A0A5C6M2Y8_9PLAN|nr:NADH oxidoreductase [Planctomyces bekefii]